MIISFPLHHGSRGAQGGGQGNQGEQWAQGGVGGRSSPLSVRSGPVDLLQQPKQLLMDGYRFQDVMFDPIEYNRYDDLIPSRIGVFRDKAYIDQELFDQDGGGTSPSIGTAAQLKARGDQDKYLTGTKDDLIEDSTRPFGSWVAYGYPHDRREINYPNKIFSWGDVIHRYQNEIKI